MLPKNSSHIYSDNPSKSSMNNSALPYYRHPQWLDIIGGKKNMWVNSSMDNLALPYGKPPPWLAIIGRKRTCG